MLEVSSSTLADTGRFDFLLYEFRFLNGRNPPKIGFYFLPEHVLPDEFFESDALEVSFDRPEFKKYYRTVAKSGDRAKHILDIIDDNPQPRRTCRPHRRSVFEQPIASRVVARLRQLQKPRNAPRPKPERSKALCHRRAFTGILDQCAER